jgi:hypothetical protein
MTFSEIHITPEISTFFQENKVELTNFEEANTLLKSVSGVNVFFSSEAEVAVLLEKIERQNSLVSEPDRREYGDFQTNDTLASKVTEYAHSIIDCSVEFILEPTCGKGNFIIATLEQFPKVKKIVGVEIYQPYVWETKFKILSHFLKNGQNPKPEIDIIHGNAFEFSYEELAKETASLNTLIIENPPWVTNAELGSIDSKNLPTKSNFKNHGGFEALTGKGNFDIGEYITLLMLNSFQNHNGSLAFLVKNSVIKNIIQDQKRSRFRIADSEKLNIDAKKEFNAAVNASLFFTKLNQEPKFHCKESNFYTKEKQTTFGWYKSRFVYSIDDYDKSSKIDGKSIFTWRSGVKHDSSKIMELEKRDNLYINALEEKVALEPELVYGLLKSSDLKGKQIDSFRKSTIITQKKIGESTTYIATDFPLTFRYLDSHKSHFDKRKSSIYTDKPPFSIFGIGEYSFAKYKVAISELYKSTHFTLVLPDGSKSIMLDDTCYFIGFDDLAFAQIAHCLVNSDLVQKFLKSITFSDAKRSINKDTLMRIDFEKAFETLEFETVKKSLHNLTFDNWVAFHELINAKTKTPQLALF